MSDPYRPPSGPNTSATRTSNIGFIIGGLVVAVALLLWFVFGDKPPTGADNSDTTNSVTVETPAPTEPAPAPAPATPVTPVPADPVTPVPADPVTPAPGDPVTPAPADPTTTPPAAPANP